MTDMPVEAPVEIKPVSKRTPRTMATRLADIRLAIENALSDPQLLSRLAPYGYTEERLQSARAQYQQVIALRRQKEIEDGQHRSSSRAFEQTWERAWKAYARLYKLARVALQDEEGMCLALGINGQRNRRFKDAVDQAHQFYDNALNDPGILEKLSGGGITPGMLTEGKTMLDQAVLARATKQSARGDAQQYTLDRDAAFTDLERWFSRFVAVARIALEQEPQWLEKLGITVITR